MFPAGTHAAAAAVQAAAAAAAGGLLPNHSFAVKDLISSGKMQEKGNRLDILRFKKFHENIFYFENYKKIFFSIQQWKLFVEPMKKIIGKGIRFLDFFFVLKR